MTTEFVTDADLNKMSHITFDEFCEVCKIIDPETHGGKLFHRYSNCLKNIENEFKYPHYYNGLIACLLLFSYDESYDLNDCATIDIMFHETKQLLDLTLTGFEEFAGFDDNALNNLITTLKEMSSIFRKEHGNYHSALHHIISKEIRTEEFFENENGNRTQIKPVDFSKTNSSRKMNYRMMEIYRHVPLKDSLTGGEYIREMSKEFENAFASITSGFVLTTIIGTFICDNLLSDIR